MSAAPGISGTPSYAHPPILEASIVVSIEPLPVERLAILGRLGERLEGQYPKAQLLTDFRSGFLPPAPGVSGMVFISEDERRIVQARSDQFSFGQREEYSGWDIFLPTARAAWEAYKNLVQPNSLKRLTVKYINSITFPLGIPLRELFNTYPQAPDADVLFESLSMHYRIPVPEIPGMSLSVLMMNNGKPEQAGQMLLDNTLSMAITSEERMWSLMPTIRQVKNAAFESQLSQKLKDTFNA